jgi:hypothetical protein
MVEDFEVLSALLDGELVQIEDLETVLNTAAGRRALIEFVSLRNEARTNVDPPHPDFSEAVRRRVRWSTVFMGKRVPLPVAAAAVLLAVLFVSALNTRVFESERQASGPPEATRILRFEPGVDWKMEAR